MSREQEIIETEIHLANLKRQKAEEEYEQAKSQLAQVRAALREKLKESQALVTRVKNAQHKCDLLREDLKNLNLHIAAHEEEKPAAAAVLSPSEDPEVADWTKQNDKLRSERRRLIEQIDNENPIRFHLDEVKFATAIRQLQLAERNLIIKLQGGELGGNDGGYSATASTF